MALVIDEYIEIRFDGLLNDDQMKLYPKQRRKKQ